MGFEGNDRHQGKYIAFPLREGHLNTEGHENTLPKGHYMGFLAYQKEQMPQTIAPTIGQGL